MNADLISRTAKHLKITLSPQEYAVLRARYRTPGGVHYVPEADEVEFWEAIPDYLIARCPFCGSTYTERMDTYSLDEWMPADAASVGTWVWNDEYQRIVGCRDFVGVQSFINLNDLQPTEIRYYRGGSEVPYVMPIFLLDDPLSQAVMHSLPICRVEANKFVPRYSLFVITYFSQDPHALIDRRLEKDRNSNDPEFHLPMMYTWHEANTDPIAWDLLHWVSTGKLLWLDLDQDTLPLRSEAVEVFPYKDITGLRQGFVYRNGRLHVSRV
jgi:hypothetical protein